ncbi:MAG: cobyric acid synthase [Chloroflexota bacterium]
MVQGTASSVGKSILVTALCRIFRQNGYTVAPFKAQNMALNSFVTADGGEIGRSQAVQAEAAGAEMSVDMNPILLKPEADARCQVVVRGRPYVTATAYGYYEYRERLWPIVLESLERLRTSYDVVVIEGAGSPAEVNLRERDIVNMSVALAVQAPVLLVADIDRGGVFASLVGTLELLEPPECALVKAMVINKFRGDVALLQQGLDFLEQRTGVPVAGVIPFFRDIHITEEDSVSLEGERWRTKQGGVLDVAVIRLPHISNFDDFDPLQSEPDVRLRLVQSAQELGRPDLLILPGSKTTVDDLRRLREVGLAEGILGLARMGTPIIGICGGYQMLGRTIHDPLGVESSEPRVEGLGLLPVETTFTAEKRTCRVRGQVVADKGLLSLACGQEVEGYEIHMAETTGEAPAVVRLSRQADDVVTVLDGALSENGLIFGTYVHGLFDRRGFRESVLRWLAQRKEVSLRAVEREVTRDEQYDRLATLVRASLNMPLIYRIAGLEGWQ